MDNRKQHLVALVSVGVYSCEIWGSMKSKRKQLSPAKQRDVVQDYVRRAFRVVQATLTPEQIRSSLLGNTFDAMSVFSGCQHEISIRSNMRPSS